MGRACCIILLVASSATAGAERLRQVPPAALSPGEQALARAASYARVGHKADQGEVAEANVYRALRAARRLGISAVRADLLLGSFYRQRGRFDAALTTLLRVLVAAPEQPHAMVELWRTLYEVTLRRARVATDLDAIRDRLVGMGLHFPRRYRLRKNAASQARQVTAAGYAALLAGRHEHATELFEAAIDVWPAHAAAHRGLGIARARRQDQLRAAGAYQLYLALDPFASDAAQVERVLVRYWQSRRR